MQEMVIKVSPDILIGQAGVVLNRIYSVERHFQKIESAVQRSANYWEGDAGDIHRRVYRDYKNEIVEVLKRFRETAQILEEISGNYMGGEASAEEEASGLPTDIIM